MPRLLPVAVPHVAVVLPERGRAPAGHGGGMRLSWLAWQREVLQRWHEGRDGVLPWKAEEIQSY